MTAEFESFVDSLPDGWTVDRLKDIVQLRGEKTDQPSEEEDYLELEDLESGTGRLLSRRNTLEVESAVTLFKKGDILFGKLRPYLEKFHHAEFDGKCTGEILAFNPTRVRGRFLFYCVASQWFISRCTVLAYGAKMPRVNWPTQLAQFRIPLPPRREQDRIAEYLDSSCAAIDAAIEAKRSQLTALEAVRDSIVEDAITNGLTPAVKMRTVGEDWLSAVPEHWDVVRVKRVLSRLDYGISESTAEEGQYPVLKMGNIQRGEIIYSDIEFVDAVPEELLLQEQDLLYNRTNSPDQVAKAALYRGGGEHKEVTFASYLVRLRVNHRADAQFLNYVLNSVGFLSFARRLAIPSVQQSNLNSTRYGRISIPLPPIQEQRAIRDYLDRTLQKDMQVMTVINEQLEKLKAYRRALIHECVTGRLRVWDDAHQGAAHA